ncbi:MAG: LPXTG cell wall anchor domain-containing protein [Lactobacillus sp.]|nr:LPXTG cell wall anchor domain-containing protein [Lactobacillus sp.]
MSAKLPQTGEASDKGLTALGLALLGSTLLPLAYFRRRKN